MGSTKVLSLSQVKTKYMCRDPDNIHHHSDNQKDVLTPAGLCQRMKETRNLLKQYLGQVTTIFLLKLVKHQST